MNSLSLTLFLLISASPVEGAPAHSRMLEQCESGVSKACFDYGLYLQSQRDPQARRNAGMYIRKACSMAYAPACSQKTPPVVLPGRPVGGSEEDLVNELDAHRAQVQKTVGNIQTKYGSQGGAADPAAAVQLGARVSIWEAMGFRATPFLVKLLGAKAFSYTGSVQAEEDSAK